MGSLMDVTLSNYHLRMSINQIMEILNRINSKQHPIPTERSRELFSQSIYCRPALISG